MVVSCEFRVAASRPKALAMVERVAGILPAIRRRDAFDTAIAKLRLTMPPRPCPFAAKDVRLWSLVALFPLPLDFPAHFLRGLCICMML